MMVYVAVNVGRDHGTSVVGVAASSALAREMVEYARGEPLSEEAGTCCLLNHPPDGTRDVVGYAAPCEVVGAGPLLEALLAHRAADDHFTSCRDGCGASMSGDVWHCGEYGRLKGEARRLTDVCVAAQGATL